ncbi:MAG: HEAT repeat domain-containing protein [Desulfobacteraceae bacterium]|jgi:hypothetical protein|nr:MAG: HEAT repeat domain-containing protein [Desulfobacteraceae bacterium]
MKTHLVVLQSGVMDPLAKLGPASRSGRIYLRLSTPLPEGEGIILKLMGMSPHKSYLLDGFIVSCFPIRDTLFQVQADVSQSLAALLIQNETDSPPAKSPPKTRPEAPAKIRKEAIKKTPEKPKTREIVELPEIEEIEEISITDMVEILPDDNAMPSAHAAPTYPGDTVSEDSGKILGMEDIRQIISQEEMAIPVEVEKPAPAPVIKEKKTLTDAERKKAEPVGKFLVNLTKAMCRSGYYDPEHPSAANAKKGLYEEFINNAGQYNEIVFTREKSRELIDIFITGVTDEQVSVRMLVGANAAELFLPKLSDYYDRKGLLSFAIRKEIALEHFDRFIDIMSDPAVDRHESVKAGDVLTKALIDNEITEISTVFVSDRIDLGLDVPWRVEMAIQRLAKDFKIMPMFKNVSTDALKQIKMQTIADILRPLKHPRYYNDFLVNCHIISRQVKDLPPEEIEGIIVDAFPIGLLIPTTQFTFEELERLEKLRREQPEENKIHHRLIGIRRVLRLVAGRVARERPSGAIYYLTQLYRNEILSFHDLPPEAQYLINSSKIAADIISDFSKYEKMLLRSDMPGDAVTCLKCFRRAANTLIEDKNYDILTKISRLIRESVNGNKLLQSDDFIRELLSQPASLEMESAEPIRRDSPEPSAVLLDFIFAAHSALLLKAFIEAVPEDRKKIGAIIETIESLGVRMMTRILSESKDKEIRKTAVETLIRMGEWSRKWALDTLENIKSAWYLHRNAMMILRNVSKHAEDFEPVRMFISHENARIREEVIGLIVALRPSDRELLIIEALDDDDARVRWRAVRALSDISPISGPGLNEILAIVTAPLEKEKSAATEQKKKIANLISAINGMPEIPNLSRVEYDILTVIDSLSTQDGGILKFLKKKTIAEEDAAVIKAALPLLARIGTTASEKLLTRIQSLLPHSSGEIESALGKIREREGH